MNGPGGGSTIFPILFGDFADACGSLPWEAFRARFPHPFVEAHFKSKGADPISLLSTSTAEREDISLQDIHAHWHYATIFSLTKSSHNKAVEYITVGRAPTNDITIPSDAVSKVHAAFRNDPVTGSFAVYDAESKHGTVLDGRRLRQGEGATLKSGADIVLAGCVHLLFFETKDFYDYMRLKLRTGRTRLRMAPNPGSPS
jgi:hypothetical protein